MSRPEAKPCRRFKPFSVLSPLPKGWANDEKRIFTQLRLEQIHDCDARMRSSCPADYLDEADILLTWGSVHDCNITFLYKQGKKYCLYVKDDYKPRLYPVDNLRKFLEEEFQKQDPSVYDEDSTDEENFDYEDEKEFEEEEDEEESLDEDEESADEDGESEDEGGENGEGVSLDEQSKDEQAIDKASNAQEMLQDS